MMTPTFEQPMLSLAPQSIDKIHDIDDLGAMWTGKLVFFVLELIYYTIICI